MVICMVIFQASTSFGEPNISGQRGLLRVTSAELPKTGEIAVSVHDGYFSQKDLLTSDFKLAKNSLRVTAGYTPMKFLEVSLGTNIESSWLTPSGGDTQVASTIGDLELNVKGGYELLPELALGGRVRGLFYTPFEPDSGYDMAATSFGIDLLATYNFTKWANPLPLKATLNIGYLVDNTGELLEDTPGDKPSKSDYPITHYAADIRGDNVINLGLGVEVPLPEYYITPLLEITTSFASSYSVYKESGNSNFDSVSLLQNPFIVTPGIRVTPPIEGLNVDIGVDIGLSGTIKEDVGIGSSQDVYVTPQWAVLAGISYAFTPVIKKAAPTPEPTAEPPKPAEGTK